MGREALPGGVNSPAGGDKQPALDASGAGKPDGVRTDRARPVLFWLFIASLTIYAFTAGSNFTSGDSFAELHVTSSVLGHGWFDVPVQKAGVACAGWGCRGADGRYYASHAAGYSIFLIPFYGVAEAGRELAQAPNCGDPFWTRCIPIHLISWNTTLVSAATVALLALFGLELGYDLNSAVTVALLYGFAGMAWPYSRYGFDVTLTGILVLASLREVALALAHPPAGARWLRAGTWSALAVLVRLPTAIVVVPLAVACLLAYPRDTGSRCRRLAALAAPLVAAAGITAWYNLVRFGTMFDDGHSANAADRLSTAPWAGLYGIALSPGKGLIWYCPIVVLAVLAAPAFYRARRATCLLALSVGAISLLPYVLVNDWYGGDAWGPRFVMPVLPLLLLPLLELRSLISTSVLNKAGAIALTAVSVCVQLAGLLVSYNERLTLAARKGFGTSIFWNPMHSPLLDQVGTLITYLATPAAASHPVPETQSFDVWWLDLWRIDGVSPTASMCAGAIAGLLAVAAVCRLVALTAQARGHV